MARLVEIECNNHDCLSFGMIWEANVRYEKVDEYYYEMVPVGGSDVNCGECGQLGDEL